MCGRYTAAKDFNELIKMVGVVMARVAFFAPRYNIAPTQMAPVIFHDNNQPAVKLMRWGLIPSWAKDESVGNALMQCAGRLPNCRKSFAFRLFLRNTKNVHRLKSARFLAVRPKRSRPGFIGHDNNCV
jgi:putative SOS response-associated peptidase YedK